MNAPRVLLMQLSERTSAKGNRYMSGWLGKASVVAFPGEPDKHGNPTWDLFVSEPEPRPEARDEGGAAKASAQERPARAPAGPSGHRDGWRGSPRIPPARQRRPAGSAGRRRGLLRRRSRGRGAVTVAPVPALRLPRELPGGGRRALAAAARGAGGGRGVGGRRGAVPAAPARALRVPRELPGGVRRAVAAAARGAGGRREVGAGQDAEGGAVTDDGDLGEPERYEPVLTAEERAGLRLEWLAG